MPPPTLHPRSRATSTLFTSTLLLAFAVVSLPHLLPCPVPSRVLADHDRTSFAALPPDEQKRRIREWQQRQRQNKLSAQQDSAEFAPEQRSDKNLIPSTTGSSQSDTQRECPVPKPRGWIGQILGVSDSAGESREPGQQHVAPRVQIRRQSKNDEG